MTTLEPCGITIVHDPHPYQSFIAGGPPGSVPTIGRMCPGRILDAALFDAATLPPGFTAADGVILMAIESGVSLQPWQFDYLARFYRGGWRP